MLFSPRLSGPKKLLWNRFLKRFIPSFSCPRQPYPLLPFPSSLRNCAEWLCGAEGQLMPLSHVRCKHCPWNKPPLSTGFPQTPALALSPFKKKSRDLHHSGVTTLIPLKLHLLLPSPPLRYIHVGKGAGFASQNAGCESFLYLKGIVSFSVPRFRAQDSLMSAQGSHRAMGTYPPQARWGPTDCGAQFASPSLKNLSCSTNRSFTWSLFNLHVWIK